MRRLSVIAVLALGLVGAWPRPAPAQLWYQHQVGAMWVTYPLGGLINMESVVWPRNDRQAPKAFEWPIDEWLPGMDGWVSPANNIEKLQRASQTSQQERITWGAWGDNTSTVRERLITNRFPTQDLARRHRPPYVYSGVEEKLETAPWANSINLTLPTESQIDAAGRSPTAGGALYRWTSWSSVNPNHTNYEIGRWREVYDGVESERGGATGDSVIKIWPGQERKEWQGADNLWGWERQFYMYWRGGGQHGINVNWKHYDLMTRAVQIPGFTTADAPRAAMQKIWYGWDDSHPTRVLDWDGVYYMNRGKPYMGERMTRDRNLETGELTASKMPGQAVLHFDRAGNDERDLYDPANVRSSAPQIGFAIGVLNSIWSTWNNDPVKRWAWKTGTSTDVQFDAEGIYRSTAYKHYKTNGMTATSILATPATDLETRGGNMENMISGPYIINSGEDHDWFYVEGAADLSKEVRVTEGAKYLNWVTAQKSTAVHPKGNPAGPKLTPLELWNLCETVKDSLANNFDKALFAFHGGRNSGLSIQAKKNGLGIARMPEPPPAPDAFYKGGPSRNEVYAWYPDASYFLDMDTQVDDFQGWRVWRKRGRADFGEIEEVRNRGYLYWEVVATVSATGAVDGQGRALPATATSPLNAATHYNDQITFRDGTSREVFRFFDSNILTGEPYYYAVTGIDNGTQNLYDVVPGASLEGSRYINVNALSVSPFTPGINSTNEIAVVPNPWSMDAGVFLFSGNNVNRILFTGLPPLATLKIFNETGDHVFTIEHRSLSGTELWHQETSSGQIVNSGIYILAITDANTFDLAQNKVGASLPDTFVKFVIIR